MFGYTVIKTSELEALRLKEAADRQLISLQVDQMVSVNNTCARLAREKSDLEAELATLRTARARSNANLRNANAERSRLASLRGEAAGLIPQVSK